MSDLNGVWGSDAANIYVVGNGLILFSGDGGRNWRRENVMGGPYLTAVRGRSANEVFAVGRGGVILRRR